MKRFVMPVCFSLLCMLSAIIFGSCTHHDEDLLTSSSDGDMQVRFEVTLPADAQTRSLATDGSDEAYVGDIDILAFVNDGVGNYLYSYPVTNITKTISGSTVSMVGEAKVYPTQQIFVILVNSRAQLNTANVKLGETIAAVLPRLQYYSATEWNAKNNGSPLFTPFPMYGKSTPQVITKAANTLNGIGLCRMVARLDVRLNAAITKTNFELVNACVFNRMNYSYIPYDFSGWDGAKATLAPVIAANPNGSTIIQPTVTYLADNTNDARGEILRSIYTIEASGRTEADKLKATALVIGGKYNGSATVKYYRVDIAPASTPAGNISKDILRNHHYDIVVKKVTADGYDTPLDAFIGDARLEATVTEWDLAKQNVIFDGKEFLEVSHEVLDFGKDGGAPTIDLSTSYSGIDGNFPAGIFISAPNYTLGAAGWLTVANVVNSDGSLTRRIRVTAAANATGSNRKAELAIKAGNLTYTLKINQSKDSWLTYTTEPQYLMDGDFKAFNVKSSYDWTAAVKAGTNPYGSLLSIRNATGGSKPLGENVNFHVKDRLGDIIKGIMPPAYIENVTVTMSDSKGVNYPVDVPLELVAASVRKGSNCYMVNTADQTPFIIPLSHIDYATGYNSSTQPTTVGNGFLGINWVTAADYPKMKATVLWSDVNDFGTDNSVVKSVVLTDGDIHNGSIIVLPGLAAGNSLIIYYKDNNSNNKYDEGTDEIKWSWHIWNAGVWPYNTDGTVDKTTYNFLDRNLGATTNTLGQVTSLGFYYQWGRKDPYLGAGAVSAHNTESHKVAYFNSAEVTGMTNPTISSGNSFRGEYTMSYNACNLDRATKNPTVRYLTTSQPHDWYAPTISGRERGLWGGRAGANGINGQEYLFNSGALYYKSVYDPCPEGYRIPRTGEFGPYQGNEAGWDYNSTWGNIHHKYGGNFPYTGRLIMSSKDVEYVGTTGYYWVSNDSTNDGAGEMLYAGYTSTYPCYSAAKDSGIAVRCIAE